MRFSSAGVHRVLNGATSLVHASTAGIGSNSSGNLTQIALGSWVGGSLFSKLDLAHFTVIDGDASAGDRAAIYGALGSYYEIALA